jgi:hydrogenase expression/formation protein HypC
MCLAIPAKITKIENNMGIVEMGGTHREVSLLLQEDAKVGDYVIVHAGFAIHKIDEAEALESLKVLREMASLIDEETELNGETE